MRKHTKIFHCKYSLALVVLLILTSCGSGRGNNGPSIEEEASSTSGSAPSESISFEERNRRLEIAITEFEWPSNYYPDIEAAIATAPQNAVDGSFQEGYEYTMLSVAHMCAWSLEWLDARANNDEASAAVALAFLTDVIPANPTFASMSDSLSDLAADAALGDPSGISGYVQANCLDIPFTTSPQPESRNTDMPTS